MRDAFRYLTSRLEDCDPSPTLVVTCHRVDGTTTCRVHVDDCGDRYVEVSDSAASADFLVTTRNLRDARTVVVGSVLDAVACARADLASLRETK